VGVKSLAFDDSGVRPPKECLLVLVDPVAVLVSEPGFS
jgi:hypothetical protein